MRPHSQLMSATNGGGGDSMIHDGVELPSLLPLEKAAAILKIDIETLHACIDSGEIACVRANGKIRVLTSSIANRMGQRTPSRPNQEVDDIA